MNTLQAYCFFSIFCILLISCNKPSLIGNDLLADGELEVEFTDSISFRVKNLPIAKTLTLETDNTNGVVLTNHLLGKINDPVFGRSESSIFAEFRLTSTTDFDGAVLDSVVMSLSYDTVGFYGDTNLMQTIEVYRLSEEMDNLTEYYSDQTFMTEMLPIGTYSFMASPRTLVQVIDTTGGEMDTTNLSPHINFHLSNDFGNEILGLDTTFTTSDSLFADYIKGFQIRSTGSDNTMMSFNLTGTQSKITFYYKQDGEDKVFNLRLTSSSVRTVNFQHDYTGSFVENLMDDFEKGDEYMLVQSMSGINVLLEFGDVSSLNNSVISKAELVCTVADIAGDDLSLYPTIERILGHEQDDNNEYVVSPDVFNSIRVGSFDVFGGSPSPNVDSTQTQYSFNVTEQLQQVVNGGSNEFYLTSFAETETRIFNNVPTPSKAENSSRTIFYGPKNTEFPAQLNVTYIKR